MERASSTYRDRRGTFRVLVDKPEGRRPLERPRRRWGGIGDGGIEWFDLRIGTGGGLL